MRNKLISGLAGAAFSFAASGLAFAADMAVKAPPPAPAPAPVANWTGFYIGGTLGGAWTDHVDVVTTNTPGSPPIFGLPSNIAAVSAAGTGSLGHAAFAALAAFAAAAVPSG